ncbi:MAG: hypothetical protein R3B93_14685 [Bacteroidia bacterium]
MYKYIIILSALFLGLSNTDLTAQPFYGYQTIGVHTFYFSVSWDGQPHLGAGYIFRNFGKTFTDINAEWRFPVAEMYKLDNHQIIAGVYKPLRLKRTFASIGVHAKIKKQTFDDTKVTHYGLGLSVLPSYVYAASLTDGLYGTTGLILNYEPVLFSQVKKGDAKSEFQALTGHRVRAGLHLDAHFERTLGISANGFLTRTWVKDESLFAPGEDEFKIEGDLNIGTTYFLERAF